MGPPDVAAVCAVATAGHKTAVVATGSRDCKNIPARMTRTLQTAAEILVAVTQPMPRIHRVAPRCQRARSFVPSWVGFVQSLKYALARIRT
jgi:hypothetical protein